MISDMWPSAIVTRRKPWRANWRRTISTIGVVPTGMTGLGSTNVYGARRRPLPPARITTRPGAGCVLMRSDVVTVGLERILVLRHVGNDPLEAVVQRNRR